MNTSHFLLRRHVAVFTAIALALSAVSCVNQVTDPTTASNPASSTATVTSNTSGTNSSQVVTNWVLKNVPYGTGSNQWLNLYRAKSSGPAPLFIYSHYNGANPTYIESNASIMLLTNMGVTLVSWASIAMVVNSNQIRECLADANAMFAFLQSKATEYQIDTTKVIIGGQSRGSITSWPMAHSGAHVKGIYMAQALPDSIWDATNVFWDPRTNVTVSAPPIYLTYGPDYNTTDTHEPLNGAMITNRYQSLGIGSQVKGFVVNMGFGDWWQFLPGFATNVFGF